MGGLSPREKVKTIGDRMWATVFRNSKTQSGQNVFQGGREKGQETKRWNWEKRKGNKKKAPPGEKFAYEGA